MVATTFKLCLMNLYLHNIGDIFWIKDKSLADLDNLPPADELAADIIENLQSALESFQGLMGQLKNANSF